MKTDRKHNASIIIVNYNGKHFLHDCLTPVLAQLAEDDEVIIVDNASWDGSTAYIRETFPTVRLIESKANLGFAGGNNLGVKHAAGDHIILLNNDTIVRPGWLEGLKNAIAEERVACASSLIKTEGIPDRYYEKNGSINFLGHNIMRIFEEPSDIFFAGGASMIFKKDILGIPFDEDYFVYAEDVYLGLRTRFMGYQIRHTNESALDHFGSGTSKHQKNTFLTYYQERNRLMNTVLFFSPKTVFKVFPFIFVNCFGKCFLSLLGQKYSLVGLLHAYGWFFINFRTMMLKRKQLRAERTVHENEVIRFMTGKLTNGESPVGKFVNAVALAYCRMVNLTVIELSK
ncbi:MAG: glycosyltransferase family 2 protein [Bacteroidota bacterium]